MQLLALDDTDGPEADASLANASRFAYKTSEGRVAVGTDVDDFVDVLVRIWALFGNVVGRGDTDNDALGMQIGEDGLRDGTRNDGAFFAAGLVLLRCMLGFLGKGIGRDGWKLATVFFGSSSRLLTACAVTGGSKGVAASTDASGQEVASQCHVEWLPPRAHRSANHDRLADVAVLLRQVRVSWWKRAGGSLPMYEQPLPCTVHDVLLDACDVVRDVVDDA